ncbi:hypothetical protein L2D01_06850 [Hyphomonadaceae bacterium ML37]|nr:hypothetical protein L2D01_06850 [Hyphomonadaceae bacterium ML37]
MGASIDGMVIVALLLVGALVVFPCWRIISRTGLPGALGLLAIIPVANLVLLWVLAFIDWPALKRTGSNND